MSIRVTSTLLEQLKGEASACRPQECCGILVGHGSRITAIVPTRNIHPAPQTHFEIDPQALVNAHRAARAGGPQVLGYFHSHPSGPARPSATDAAMASGDGRIWAIIGGAVDHAGDIAFWKDGEHGFMPLPYIAEPA